MSDDDYLPPSTTLSLSSSTGGGLASLLIGCTLLISACVLMVFNVILFRGGLRGIPQDLAQIGGLVGTAGVAVLGVISVIIAARSWGAASKNGESSTLGFAAFAASFVGLIGWLIAAVDLMMILLE